MSLNYYVVDAFAEEQQYNSSKMMVEQLGFSCGILLFANGIFQGSWPTDIHKSLGHIWM